LSWELSLLVIGGLLTLVIALGVPVAAAMGLVGIVSITLLRGTQLWPSLGDIIWNTASSFTLVAIPLFVLMGEIILSAARSRRCSTATPG
jgi:C4-dicarboxylate transporter, DctM subunit